MIEKIKNFIADNWYYASLCTIFTICIFYRLFAYCLFSEFWLDEAALASNFIKNTGFLWIFKQLDNTQIAPPLFLLLIKITTLRFGAIEHSLKFTPLISSLATIPVFYFLSIKFFNTKRAILLSNFLFAVNFIMARYSGEFKQYSTDVLVFMSALIMADKITTENLSKIKAIKYAIIFTLLFFLSQPVIFILCGFFIYNFLKNPKKPLTYIITVIPLFFALVYRAFQPLELMLRMKQYWSDCFIAFNNFNRIINENFMFFTDQKPFSEFLAIFAIIGFPILIFKKSKINRIFAFSFFGIIMAGILHIYPVYQRLILFLLPFIIFSIAQCIDFKIKPAKYDKVLSMAAILVIIVSLVLFRLSLKKNCRRFMNAGRAQTIAVFLKENFNQSTDNLILNPGADVVYKYYSRRLDMGISENKIVRINFRNTADFIKDIKTLKQNVFYWLYIPHPTDYIHLKALLNASDIYYSIDLANFRLYKIKIKNPL